MSDVESDDPLIAYRVVPVAGRTPVVLLRVEVAEPATKSVAIVLDFSDSCVSLEKQLELLRKLLGTLPPSWPLAIYCLGNPDPIGNPANSLASFLDCSNPIRDLCDDRMLDQRFRGRGSFIRPCLEGICGHLGQNASKGDCLVFVLTDGQFSDFGAINVPSSLDVVAITPTSVSAASTMFPRDCIQFFDVRDQKIDSVIGRHRLPFFGPVRIELLEPTVDLATVFRVAPGDRLINWNSIHNHSVNLAAGNLHLVVDADLSVAKKLRWKITSLVTQETCVLATEDEAIPSESHIEKVVSTHFSSLRNGEDVSYLFRFTEQSSDMPEACAAFDAALCLANSSAPWIDEAGKMRVLQNPVLTAMCEEHGNARCDAMLLLCTSRKSDDRAHEVLALGLSRSNEFGFRINSGDRLGESVATADFSIRFDRSHYRWMLQIADANPQELEYYASEVLSLPISHSENEIIAVFSGNLR
nr:hypothetical protein [Rhodopirellula sp. SM50]